MLDPVLKPYLDSTLGKLASPVASMGLSPTLISVIGFVFGLCGCFTVAMGNYLSGLVLILMGRVIDGLAARTQETGTEFSNYLRITLEWILYAAFVFFFVLSQIEHSTGAVFLLFTYVMIAVTALSYKVIAAKNGRMDDEISDGFFHPARLVERTEILIFMILCCLAPAFFSGFAMLFGLLALVTAGGWIFKARQNF